MIERSLIIWFALTAISVLYVAWDTFRNNPEMAVMKWGFILVTLFMGPLGACIYVLSCKPPVPRDHAAFVTPLWKQAVGSTIHCLAGDATGIIVAAAVTMAIGLVMWHDLIAEYVLGFGFGLFVFQALFTRQMLGGSYRKALATSLYPEWISMNAVMAGMVPTMVIVMSKDMTSMHPSSVRFWGVMSIASIVGFFFAYPLNLWLVGVRLKHGMGTVLALGKGGHSMEMESATATEAADGTAATATHMSDDSTPTATTRQQRWAMGILSLIALWAGVLLAAWGGDLTMSPGGGMAEMPPGMHPMEPAGSQP